MDATQSAIMKMIMNLNAGNPVIVGVTHSNFQIKTGNYNAATQHFIVITAYQPSVDGYEFTYIETGRSSSMWAQATSDGNILFYDFDNCWITGPNYKSGGATSKPWEDYIVTETRTQ